LLAVERIDLLSPDLGPATQRAGCLRVMCPQVAGEPRHGGGKAHEHLRALREQPARRLVEARFIELTGVEHAAVPDPVQDGVRSAPELQGLRADRYAVPQPSAVLAR